MAGSGNERAVTGLGEGEDVAAVETRAELLPVRTGIQGPEDAAELLVVHNTRIEMRGIVAVDEEGRDLALGDACVRLREGAAGVVAREDAAAIGGEQHATGVCGIDIDVVDDHVRIRHGREGLAGVDGFVEPLGGSGVDHLAVFGILHEHACAPRLGGNALNFVEEQARVFALVDAAAGAQVNDVRVAGIDDDGEDVGVLDDSLLDIAPGLAAVGGLPGQVPGAGVDDLGIRGIDGQRLDLVDLVTAGRADLGPGDAGVGGAVDALKRSREENARIGGSFGESLHRLAFEERHFRPGARGVVADPEAAVVVVLPRAHVEGGGMGGIDHDVVDHEAVAVIELGQAMPGCAFIARFIEPTVGGAEIEMAGLAGHGGEGARVAPVGAGDGKGKRRRAGLDSKAG